MKSEKQYKLEYGKQVANYLNACGLTEEDLARLINSTSDNIKKIINGHVGLTIGKMIKIANVFSVDYYHFANPSHKIPHLGNLPKQTKQKINERAAKGILERDNENLLANELNRVISEGKLNTPATAQILQLWMDARLANRNSTEITSLLNKPPRNKYIVKLKRVGKQIVFVHKDFASQYADLGVAELKEILAEAERNAKNLDDSAD